MSNGVIVSMDVRVSVIVPVYNGEGYLLPCLQSLAAQTLKEWEVIVVNDGSSDGSGAVAERFSESDSRFRVIHQENQGVSAARNAGIRQARGDYLGFVDADDTVEPDFLETLYREALKDRCDIVVSTFESELEGRKVVTDYPFPADLLMGKKEIQEEILPYFIRTDQLNTACTKLYRRTMIQDNAVEFPLKMALGEDGIFNMRAFQQAERIKFLRYTGYQYRETEGSATRNLRDKDYFQRALEVHTTDYSKLLPNYKDENKIRRLRSIRLIHSVMSFVYVYFKAADEWSLTKRFGYVRRMIRHPLVQEALPDYYGEVYGTLGRYDRFLADMIRRKSTAGLYAATFYSRLRNKR
ncbi:glycosyltransferase family 2 protein [Paenibacillus aurantius]|uniref:Glycosyltransferase family 2 protein n=1 Tax=Paenibacillus aurantius TaxID=2918900 RepID=A0AA96RGN3_9BACL|nr:glycosyltransferase family 2 protein [Paenibacillus aurantius]WNQ12686.1 glycosyltransferase family 2 protein [Paenibacillus aurantius]